MKIIVSTHSAIIMNSVQPEQIHYLSSSPSVAARTSVNILEDLGYRNSDLLINDRLIFVEGPSDRTTLPILLRKTKRIDPSQLLNTGFVEMNGGGRLDGASAQTSILFYERTLKSLSRAQIPHIYLFDGDKTKDDRKLIEKVTTGNVTFLGRRELENYLLNPIAIMAGLAEASTERQLEQRWSLADVRTALESLMSTTSDPEVFPIQPIKEAKVDAQASILLRKLFAAFGLGFSKTKHCPIIATALPDGSSADLEDLAELLLPFFGS